MAKPVRPATKATRRADRADAAQAVLPLMARAEVRVGGVQAAPPLRAQVVGRARAQPRARAADRQVVMAAVRQGDQVAARVAAMAEVAAAAAAAAAAEGDTDLCVFLLSRMKPLWLGKSKQHLRMQG